MFLVISGHACCARRPWPQRGVRDCRPPRRRAQPLRPPLDNSPVLLLPGGCSAPGGWPAMAHRMSAGARLRRRPARGVESAAGQGTSAGCRDCSWSADGANHGGRGGMMPTPTCVRRVHASNLVLRTSGHRPIAGLGVSATCPALRFAHAAAGQPDRTTDEGRRFASDRAISEQSVVEMQWTTTDGLPAPPLQSWRTSTSRLRSSRAARAPLRSSRPCKSPRPPRPTELNMEVAVARCLRNLSSGKDMWPDAAAPPSRPWLHALP